MPLFYERAEGPTAPRVGAAGEASLRSLGPQVTAARMVRDYVTQLYEPTAAHADALIARTSTPPRRSSSPGRHG